jgi:hypothetical protein
LGARAPLLASSPITPREKPPIPPRNTSRELAITPYFSPGTCYVVAQPPARPRVKIALGKPLAAIAGDLGPYQNTSAIQNRQAKAGDVWRPYRRALI